MKRNIIIFSLLVSVLLLPSFSPAKSVGEVDIVINTAQELETAKLDWDRLAQKDPVMAESLVRTLEESKLKVKLIDGSILMLTENSKTRIENIKKEGKSIFRMFTGKLRAVVKRVTGSKKKFEVRTPTAVVGVKGTDFGVILRKDVTEVIVFEGSVLVSNILDGVPGEVLLKANHYTRVRRFEPPMEPIEISPGEIASLIKKHGLSEDIFLKEYADSSDKDVKTREQYGVERPNIEGTIEDEIEVPPEYFDDDTLLDDTDVTGDVIIEPPIEDTATGGIVDPPGPPNP